MTLYYAYDRCNKIWNFYIIIKSTLCSIISYIKYYNNTQPLDAISQWLVRNKINKDNINFNSITEYKNINEIGKDYWSKIKNTCFNLIKISYVLTYDLKTQLEKYFYY